MEFLLSLNLNILNHGTEPTFVVRSRKEIINLRLGTNKIADLVSNWHVSDEPFLSDYRCICFQIGNITFRVPRNTNWASYKDNLKLNLRFISRRYAR
jgi:hypothetical protein